MFKYFQEDINGQNIVTYQDMENQYEQIMTHVRKLINKNILKGQAHSELKKILVKLGIDIEMIQTGSFRIGITTAELTQQLIAKKEATFNIQKPQDCDISLCDRRFVCLKFFELIKSLSNFFGGLTRLNLPANFGAVTLFEKHNMVL